LVLRARFADQHQFAGIGFVRVDVRATRRVGRSLKPGSQEAFDRRAQGLCIEVLGQTLAIGGNDRVDSEST